MEKQQTKNYESTFAKEVIKGLSGSPKRLYSKYFYDEKGDQLFQEIMKLDDYYLTNSEYEILSTQKDQIVEAIQTDTTFQLIEFGAGDGFKTKVLIEYLIEKKIDFEYIPIDISASVLETLKSDLVERWPSIKVRPVAKTYFEALRELSSKQRKVVLFLGSSFGNFEDNQAKKFLEEVYAHLNSGDYFYLGVDLKKLPELILSAYGDKNGVTKAFNLNLLERINRELEGNFDLTQFEHYPTYDPVSGTTKSFLISLQTQKVKLKKMNETITFSYAEPIFMEISRKYSIEEVESLAVQTNFKVIKHFTDCKHYFLNSLWKK